MKNFGKVENELSLQVEGNNLYIASSGDTSVGVGSLLIIPEHDLLEYFMSVDGAEVFEHYIIVKDSKSETGKYRYNITDITFIRE